LLQQLFFLLSVAQFYRALQGGANILRHPSNCRIRKWFGHNEKKWDEFKQKYFEELDKNNDAVNTFIRMAQKQNSITLLYGTKEERFNNVVALKEYLEKKIKSWK
jgi:uncharacterized protein YeaO (DUF488 family)